VLKCRKLKT